MALPTVYNPNHSLAQLNPPQTIAQPPPYLQTAITADSYCAHNAHDPRRPPYALPPAAKALDRHRRRVHPCRTRLPQLRRDKRVFRHFIGLFPHPARLLHIQVNQKTRPSRCPPDMKTHMRQLVHQREPEFVDAVVTQRQPDFRPASSVRSTCSPKSVRESRSPQRHFHTPSPPRQEHQAHGLPATPLPHQESR